MFSFKSQIHIYFILLIAMVPVYGESKKTILYLNSYHSGYLWSENVKSGLLENLSYNDPSYNLYIEDMDTKNHDPEELFPILTELYKKKYSDHIPDVIIAADNNALNFLIRFRDTLFPGTPVVFCGINNFQDEMLEGFGSVTGVVERASYKRTIELALDLFPETKTIYSIAGYAETTKIHIEELYEASKDFSHTISFIGLHGLSLEELAFSLQNLPEESLVLYLGLYRDSLGKVLEVHESFEFIRKNTDKPIFTMWDQNLPFCLGGIMINGQEQGRSASRMALKIINGASVDSIPIVRESPNQPMFNYSELVRFGLIRDILPEDSFILNLPPPSFYSKNKKIIWVVFAVFATLLLLVFSLVLALKKTRRLWNYINSILDSSPSTIIGVDLSLKVSLWNTTAARNSGIIRTKTIGKPLREVYPLLQKNIDKVIQAILSQTPLMESRLPNRRNGQEIFEDVSVFPLISDKEKGAVIRIDDVTQRVRLHEMKLMSANLKDQLIQSQKMESIGRLAGGISHDLNNLLVPIIGYSELLNKEEGLSEKQHEALSEIFNAGIRSQDLIHQLLAFSRKQILDVRKLDLNNIIQNFEKLLRRTIRENINITIKLLPTPLPVMADRIQLEQVLMNLVVNAADSMPEGGMIVISTDLILNDPQDADTAGSIGRGKRILLTVKDSGYGMSEEIRNNIFEPFYSTKGEQGTGLGLATVHGIVKQHDGEIEVESQPGEGTLFKISLPFGGDPEDVADEVDPDFRTYPGKASGVIFIVEDNLQVLLLSQKILSSTGYDVMTASSGKSALPLIERNHIDLLLTDIVMPEMNGKELYTLALKKKPGLKVLFMSGYNDKIITYTDGKRGSFSFIQKPFTAQQLIRKVREILDR